MNNFDLFLNELKVNKPVKSVSVYNLKGYQLKNIIEQYNLKNPDKVIKGYKSKSIKELDKIIRTTPIDITDYKIINANPYGAFNIFKKAGINQYNTDEQNLYLTTLNTNERYSNPLQALNKYTNKEGKQEYLTPQKHQETYITQFIYSSLRGSVVFHGVGSGKTLTAVICSYYYLKLHPKNKVIVISPSALLFNFVAGMIQYGLDKNDSRYSFFTYEKYARNPKVAEDSLLIVDEAHNFRTEMKFKEVKDPKNPKVTIDTQVTQNNRGYKILKFGASYCHKILLLTGTAFVNVLYDIENLLAMIDNRRPVEKPVYDDILSNVANVKDHFDFKISYFKNDDSSGFFPERREKLIPIYMTPEQEQAYNKIKSEGAPHSTSEKPNSFYSAEKYASNMIDRNNNPKTQFIINEIVTKPKQKFIIYSGLYDHGIINVVKALEKNGIKFKMITGRQNTTQKEESKFYFNYYNFNNKTFYDIKTIEPQYIKFINNEYRVLLITRAGAEGVDTTNCQNIILLDGQWNDALSEQIIARAIRFKSHFGLPKSEQYVNVLRCIFCFEKNKKLIQDINNGKTDFNILKKQITESASEQLKLLSGSKERYLPTIKELKTLKINNTLYIPDKTNIKTIKGYYGRPSKTVQVGPNGWDKYNVLTTDIKRKEWRTNAYYNWLVDTKQTVEAIESSYTIDLYLYILSKAKQATIDKFISFFGEGIYMYEKYESSLIKNILKKEKELKRTLTEVEKIKIYSETKKSELTEILKFDDTLLKSRKSIRNDKNKLQQFYTNSILASYLYEYSSLKTNKNKDIVVLEPSTGEGDLIKPIISNNQTVKIDMVEIDPKNREILKVLVKKSQTYLNLTEQPNFLLFQTSTRYDYIFMNPPFHLRKSEDYNLIRDTWDYDFVKRAFAFLKIGGELLAIVSNKFLGDESFISWTNEKDKSFEFEHRKNEKFSGIKINVVILKITKKDDSNDSDLLANDFYVKQDFKGSEILKNERPLNFDSIDNKVNKMTLNSYIL